jgi:hypothetical protein
MNPHTREFLLFVFFSRAALAVMVAIAATMAAGDCVRFVRALTQPGAN